MDLVSAHADAAVPRVKGSEEACEERLRQLEHDRRYELLRRLDVQAIRLEPGGHPVTFHDATPITTVRGVDVHLAPGTRHASEGSNSLRECLPQHGIAARITWRAARGPARTIGKQESEHVHFTDRHFPRTEDRQAS